MSFGIWWEATGQHTAKPWTGDMAERTALYDRRYIRPAPPEGMRATVSLAEINRPNRDTDIRRATDDSLGGYRGYRGLTGSIDRQQIVALGIGLDDEEDAA